MSPHSLLRKLMEMPPRIIESKWGANSEGGTELNYYNLETQLLPFPRNDRSYNLNPGKNTVFRIEKAPMPAILSRLQALRYMFFRRSIPQDFRIQCSYALPVKTGERETQWQIRSQNLPKL